MSATRIDVGVGVGEIEGEIEATDSVRGVVGD
jgi:hypothetical protein